MNREQILAVLHRHENLSSAVADKIADELVRLMEVRETKKTRVFRAKETR